MVTEVVENQTQAVGFTPEVSPMPKTYEEFLEWNGTDDIWAEWENGEITYMSNPSLIHQDISDFLTAVLRFFVEAKQLGRVISAPFQLKFDFRKTGRQPDIMFVSNTNADKIKKQYVENTADLVIEVISPEIRSRDRGDKFYEYEAAAVKEYWLIDYERNQVRFYELNNEGIYQLALIENGIYHSKVLEGLFIKTDWLWQETLPTLMDVLKDWKLV